MNNKPRKDTRVLGSLGFQPMVSLLSSENDEQFLFLHDSIDLEYSVVVDNNFFAVTKSGFEHNAWLRHLSQSEFY